MQRHQVILTIGAVLSAALSLAEDSVATRDDYDAFMVAFTMEQHRGACERHAPGIYAKVLPQIAAWRTSNEANVRRWEPAARRWRLPGERSLDELLDQIAKSLDKYYASSDQETSNARCQKLLDRFR